MKENAHAFWTIIGLVAITVLFVTRSVSGDAALVAFILYGALRDIHFELKYG